MNGESAAPDVDRRVIVESATSSKPREIEVGILGNDDPQVSVVGEVLFDDDFYDYSTKYTVGRSSMLVPSTAPNAVTKQA